MCQFVYHGVVQHFFRRENEPPVEIEVSLATAAPPTGFLLFDGNASVSDVHDCGIISGLLCENVPCDAYVVPTCGRVKRG